MGVMNSHTKYTILILTGFILIGSSYMVDHYYSVDDLTKGLLVGFGIGFLCLALFNKRIKLR